MSILIVFAMSLTTILLRALPFIIFREGKPLPKLLIFAGRVLPSMMMGMLVIYCFRNTEISFPGLFAEISASLTVILSYIWKRNLLVSVIAGTLMYMILLRLF